MLPLGTLSDEPPEPMKREDFERVQKAIRATFRGDILIDRADALLLLSEIRWLRRRLQRVEHAVEPLAEAITRS
jgi:hypothetical protein